MIWAFQTLFPGRCAARSVALQNRDPCYWSRRVWVPALRSSVLDDATHRQEDAAPRPGHDTYNSFPIATAVSAMRLEKPHSLSYHDITRTSVPFSTLVWSMWNVEECGSWLKSIETLGAVV